nr:FAD-binding protein [Desulfobulbaceae bacterium]
MLTNDIEDETMDIKTNQLLIDIVGDENFSASNEDRLCYSYDGTAQEFIPEAVIFPANTEQVGKIMELASQHGFPVVPRGAGTGMTGGALAIAGGLVMVMSRFTRIVEIDVDNQLAVVEPGVITGDLQAAVRQKGLYYPPDPASLKFCTIGGNVAECAGGPSAVKYGVTRDYIKGLEVVLADGKIITTGVKTDKGVVGYDLTRLFVGSEGTLGIITKIIVRLLPQPEAKETFLVLLDSLSKAAILVAKLLSRFTPCTLEFMDQTAISIVKDKLPFTLPDTTRALLLIELDGTAESVSSEGNLLRSFVEQKAGVLEIRQAGSSAEADRLWIARRAVSPSAFKLKPHKISEDIVVPRSRIAELVEYAESLALELGLTIFCFGHAGDGNIHVNIMLDKTNAQEAANGALAKQRLFDRVIELSGTLSGEHGVGITKSGFLPLELSVDTLGAMQLIKRALDPKNILNPGKIFP